MKSMWVLVETAFAVMGGWLGWTIGELDGFLFALVVFVMADFITGVMRAILEKRLSSTMGMQEIFQKILIFVMVSLAHMLDEQLTGSGAAIRTAVIFFYIANEGVSLLENVTAVGLPVPDKIRQVLSNLRTAHKDDGKETPEEERGAGT